MENTPSIVRIPTCPLPEARSRYKHSGLSFGSIGIGLATILLTTILVVLLGMSKHNQAGQPTQMELEKNQQPFREP